METKKFYETLESIDSKIDEKKDVYISLVKTSYNVDTEVANDIFASEKEAFLTRLSSYFLEEKANVKRKGGSLPTITTRQGVNIFLEVTQVGLSFAPASEHVYLSRLKGSGTGISWVPAVRGLIFMVTKAGMISHLSEVVIVRNDDEGFKGITDTRGVKTVNHTITFEEREPFNYDKHFKLGYVYVTYVNGDKELKWVDRNEMDASKKLSSKPSNYNVIGMLKTKVISKALKYDVKTPMLLTSMGSDDIVIDDAPTIDDSPTPTIDDVPTPTIDDVPTPTIDSTPTINVEEANNEVEDFDFDFTIEDF